MDFLLKNSFFQSFSVYFIKIIHIYSLFQNITSFSFNLAFDLCALPFFLTINYVLCYSITSLTIDAMSISSIIYYMYWYQLPTKQQFIVQIIIHRAQEPFELKGLGVFVCSLETYLRVRRYSDQSSTRVLWFFSPV